MQTSQTINVNGPSNPPMTECLPPHNVEAEQFVVGSMLRHNVIIDEMILILRSEMFYKTAHQQIFTHIVERWQKGKPVDAVMMADDLKKSGFLEIVGGPSYLGVLWQEAPTPVNVDYYAAIVKNDFLLRNLAAFSAELSRDVAHPRCSAEDMVLDAEQRIFDLAEAGVESDIVGLSQTIPEALARIDKRSLRSEELSGLPTGFAGVDAMTAGLQDGELTLIAARPSTGKTAAGIAIAREISVVRKIPLLFVSLEQSRDGLSERMLCLDSQVDSHFLRTGKLTVMHQQALIESSYRLQSGKMLIDDMPGQDMARIGAMARRAKRRSGIKCVVVDYVQIVAAEDRRGNRNEQVGAISRRLQVLARELKIPLIAMCQLNRESDKNERPRLSDLRESGSLEQDADVVWLMHRPNKNEEERTNSPCFTVEINIAKNRDGRTGPVTMMFRRACMRFEPAAFPDEQVNPFVSERIRAP